MPLGKTIAFLGAGNMAEALVKGLLRAGVAAPQEIVCADRRPSDFGSHLGQPPIDSNGWPASDASIVFSFAYAYFFVAVERYDALIAFLRTILPQAGLAELHTALGYNRHGKTEFYRELHRYVHVSKEQFMIAPGKEGAVMIAFLGWVENRSPFPRGLRRASTNR